MTKSPIEQARKAAFVLDREHAQFQLARAVNDLISYAESLERKVEELEKVNFEVTGTFDNAEDLIKSLKTGE